MATLAVNKLSKDGAITIVAAAVGGDDFPAIPGNILYLQNIHASLSRTVTIAAVNTPIETPQAGSVTVSDISIVVPPATVRIAHVPPAYVADNAVAMTYSDEADLFVGVAYVG